MAHHPSNPLVSCFLQRRAVGKGYLGNREILLYHHKDESLWASVALSVGRENDTLCLKTLNAKELLMTRVFDSATQSKEFLLKSQSESFLLEPRELPTYRPLRLSSVSPGVGIEETSV